MQQRMPLLDVGDLMEGNSILKELRDPQAVIRFRKFPADTESATLCSFSNAAFNTSSSQSYCQTGAISGKRFKGYLHEPDILHAVDWSSCKKRRVSHSSYGAEILACTEGDDCGYRIKQALNSLAPRDFFRHVLHVDSKGLYDTVTTLDEGRDYRLRQQRIRDYFEAEDPNALQWIQGKANIADALTKRNPEMQRMLNRIMISGLLELPEHQAL